MATIPLASANQNPDNKRELCVNSTSTYDSIRCIEAQRQVEDIRLNKAYKTAMSTIKAFRKPDLRDIQRVWIKYRDKKCAFFYHKHSGSGGLVDSIECQLKETQKRATELERIY